MALFAETLSSIITATAIALGKPTNSLNITAFSVPQHFDDRSSMTNMLTVADRASYIQRPGQMISLFNSARLTYGLDHCGAANLPADCDFDEEENFVFVVDYGESFLSLGFSAVGSILYARIAEVNWTDPEDLRISWDCVKSNRKMHVLTQYLKLGGHEENITTPSFALQKIQEFLGTQL